MSVLNDTLDKIVQDHTTAALKIGGNDLTVVKKKLPSRQETVDAAYQVNIYAEEKAEEVRRIAQGKYLVKYFIGMTLITPNDRDTTVNLTDHIAWRESTRARYETGIAGLDRIDIRDALFMDRSQLADGYDYQTISITVWSYESR